jgi:Rps23 Pro-64 3,4-dihydroxylase Tpa1-like proline 4-hydroxylase
MDKPCPDSSSIDPSLSPLLKWINPAHLQFENLQAYQRRLESDPLSLIVLDDFLLPGVADRISCFLREEAEYKREYQSRSKEFLSPEAWEALPEAERLYRFLILQRVKPSCQMSKNWLTFLAFNDMFKQPPCFSFMESVSGMRFCDARIAGIHGHEIEDMITWHADAGRNKDFCGVFYLTPDWDETNGGELEIKRESQENYLLTPLFNRLVLFKTDKQTVHRVRPHAPTAANKVRYSYVFWYKKLMPA